MGEAVMISVTAALGLFALGLGVCVLGQPPLARSTAKQVTADVTRLGRWVTPPQ
jgi:hypothetical protein